MTHILLSIRPKWAQLILSGEKTVEIRRTMPKAGTEGIPKFINDFPAVPTVLKLYLYETSPSKMIIGEAQCDAIYDLQICCRNTYHRLRRDACLSVKEMKSYLRGNDSLLSLPTGYAFCLSNVVRYEQPLSLEEVGLKRAPMSWCYVNEGGEK